ncbi:hypothetical protein [uncultured Bacteroides sp.]|jgi:hypothetical protein|uniref:hypothetical protein n=1 Tax=uncultured Bacteroides sp. TaxID=162156 RepID=UPI002585129E|nr:hypothetical protein [uncultured Bacteroides sp.]
MSKNFKSEQNIDNKLDLQQQIIDLQNKYSFQISQNDCLQQQNKQLRHKLNIIQSLETLTFSEYFQSFNILIQLILSPVPLSSKLMSEDWKQLFKCMDILFNHKLKIKLDNYTCLSNEEIALWYFFHIGIKNINLAIFFGISIQSLCKRKQRLKDKLLHL